MKSNKNFNNKVLISILLIILFLLLIYFLINFKYKLLEGNIESKKDNLEADAKYGETGVVESESTGNKYKENIDKLIIKTSKHLKEGYQNNPDLIDDSTLKNEYMDAIKTPRELQKEMKDNNDELNTLGYLKRGLNYAKIFISADSSDREYSTIKDNETLGKEKLVETTKNCTHCYSYDNRNNTWQSCTEPAYKIVNNIPQSKNGVLPGILENVLRVIPTPAVDLIVPKVKVEKTSDLLKIKNNDIKCVNYSDNWVMVDGMYDTPYKYLGNKYETGSTEDIKGIKDKFKKQEQFSNINDNQDDIIINLYYFTLVCFFIYIITKLMIKQ